MLVIHASARPRYLALLLCLLLSGMIALASSSSPPIIGAGELESVEAGTYVKVIGLLTEYWRYDSGTEVMVLVDPSGHGTAKAVCMRGSNPPPSSYVHMGDELLVEGEVSDSKGELYTSSDQVELLKESKAALTVEVLSRCWLLFEGDEVCIQGLLVPGNLVGELRLSDPAEQHSVRLQISCAAEPCTAGTYCQVRGVVVFDASEMCILLVANSIVAVAS